jgi:putative ABC transport system permease protein
MDSPRRLRLMRRLVSWAMGTWPAATRKRDGQALLESFERELTELEVTGVRWWMDVTRECAAVAWAGISLRWTHVRYRWAGAGMGWMGDVRFAARGLRRNPGFTLTVGLTLALGIGANAAVFGIVDGILFRPPPFDRPEELVFVWRTLGPSPARFRVPAPDVAEIRRWVSTLEQVAFLDRVRDGSVEGPDASGAQHVRIATVTRNLLDLLGVQPTLGRGFRSEDAVASLPGGDAAGPGVALLSSDAWERLFGKAPDVIGQSVVLDGRSVTLIGVLPAGFRVDMPPGPGMAGQADVWVPLTVPLSDLQRADGRRVDQDSDNSGAVIGRLARGVPLLRAQTELDHMASEMRTEVPAYATSGYGLTARPMHGDATRHVRGLLTAMLAGVAALLLVTCLNVSMMILARGIRRGDELSIRTALGATRLRLARQLAVESLVLVVLGGGLAFVTAWTLSHLLSTRLPASVGVVEVGLDGRMLAFGAAVTGIVLLIFGLAPLAAAARLGGPTPRSSPVPTDGREGRDRARRALIVGQLALSIPLLLGASLLLRTFQELRAVEPGFQAEGALTFNLSLRIPGRYRGPADRAQLARAITDRLSTMSGVQSVGLTTHLPLSRGSWTQPYGLPGQAPHEWSENRADFRAVTSGLFDALGARLVSGRTFTSDEDLHEERRVVIVDELLAGRIAENGPVLGATIGVPLDGAEVYADVVGVVEHVRHERLDADGREAVYVPYRQEASREVSFVVRTTVGHPEELAPAVRAAVADLDPQLVAYGLRTMNDYVGSAVAPTRFAADVLGLFAVLSLLAVGMGLYGTIGLEVARKRRDIGLRVAIGATRRQVVLPVVGRALWLVVLGSVLGVGLAGLVVGTLGRHLFGTGLTDPRVWLAVVGTLLLVTLAACWVPASRAAAIDPRDALRAD